MKMLVGERSCWTFRWLYCKSVLSCGQYAGQYQVVEDLTQVFTVYIHNKLWTSEVYLTFHCEYLHAQHKGMHTRTSTIAGDSSIWWPILTYLHSQHYSALWTRFSLLLSFENDRQICLRKKSSTHGSLSITGPGPFACYAPNVRSIKRR